MIVALDVHYRETSATAACAGVHVATDATPAFVRTKRFDFAAAAYEPGEFRKRELPLLLEWDRSGWSTVIVDGYAWLAADHKGLGAYLHDAIGLPVIGVAKTRYKGSDAVEVLRGESKQPLFVTAAGLDIEAAAALVRSLHGDHRLPTLLRTVDAAARAP